MFKDLSNFTCPDELALRIIDYCWHFQLAAWLNIPISAYLWLHIGLQIALITMLLTLHLLLLERASKLDSLSKKLLRTKAEKLLKKKKYDFEFKDKVDYDQLRK